MGRVSSEIRFVCQAKSRFLPLCSVSLQGLRLLATVHLFGSSRATPYAFAEALLPVSVRRELVLEPRSPCLPSGSRPPTKTGSGPPLVLEAPEYPRIPPQFPWLPTVYPRKA